MAPLLGLPASLPSLETEIHRLALWHSGASALTVIGPNPLVTAGKKADKYLDAAAATPKYFQKPVAPEAKGPVNTWGPAKRPPLFLYQVSHQLPRHLDSDPQAIS